MEEYWKKEYKNLLDGVTFKFKQVNPIDHITLITKDIETASSSINNYSAFVQKCLSYVVWSRDDIQYNELLNAEGAPKLPELNTNPGIAFDLYTKFREEVIAPAFFESKTYQSRIAALSKK